jgi:hypothetical protein
MLEIVESVCPNEEILSRQILEADLRAIESLLPQDLTSCQRNKPNSHFFVSVRVVQSVGSKQCSTFVKVFLVTCVKHLMLNRL